ncbi:hypothetical protein [Peribacillus huizhouensis]|uniref:Ribosomal protein S17 n=1 Tax=Peribacillus huizhouensis TaxID=1501239 RepID=A0ABR6CR94_9BACI|nr:hypothetical protein [Peribacillus huizhouensis]MBA9027562.1 ribosomal protein S17 [Peribacillus huizhouensis]
MIKITMVDGSVIETTVEEYAKLNELLGDHFDLAPITEGPALEPLKVGDYAKVTNYGYIKISDGEIVEITETDRISISGYTFRAKKLNSDYCDVFAPHQLEKVSAEEAQKVVEEAELVVRFAKIGRKPNEFKKGDIVRVTEDRALGSRNMAGDIGEVTEVSFNFAVNVVGRRGPGGNKHMKDSVELITPVEARFDR